MSKSLEDVLQTEVGGTHYQQLTVQPIQFILERQLNFVQGSIVKYVLRAPFHPKKEECYKKALHYCEFGRTQSNSVLTDFQTRCVLEDSLKFCRTNNLSTVYVEFLHKVCAYDYSKVEQLIHEIHDAETNPIQAAK